MLSRWFCTSYVIARGPRKHGTQLLVRLSYFQPNTKIILIRVQWVRHHLSVSNSSGMSSSPLGSLYPSLYSVSYQRASLESGKRVPHQGQNRINVELFP